MEANVVPGRWSEPPPELYSLVSFYEDDMSPFSLQNFFGEGEIHSGDNVTTRTKQ